MEIVILGSGCSRCKTLEQNARKAAGELGLKAEFVKISDIDKIIDYGVMSTPAIAIDGKIMASGRMCDVDEIKEWLVK